MTQFWLCVCGFLFYFEVLPSCIMFYLSFPPIVSLCAFFPCLPVSCLPSALVCVYSLCAPSLLVFKLCCPPAWFPMCFAWAFHLNPPAYPYFTPWYVFFVSQVLLHWHCLSYYFATWYFFQYTSLPGFIRSSFSFPDPACLLCISAFGSSPF